MGIGIPSCDDEVEEAKDDSRKENCGKDVPLSNNTGDCLVQLQQQIIWKTHDEGKIKSEEKKYLHGREDIDE
jgi:hypothetical protein